MQMKKILLTTAAALTIGLAGTPAAKADWYGHGPGYGGGYDRDGGGYYGHGGYFNGRGDWHGYGYFDPYRRWHFYSGYYGVVPGYYEPPPVYYAPPPRYYAPPVYVAPPVITFGFRP